jgi:altronate dehydratase small subunit
MAERSDLAAAAQAASGAMDPRLMQLAAEDNVAVAKTTIPVGAVVLIGGVSIVFSETIPTGHKVAIAPIAAGEKITKYGAPIGSATRAIEPGQYVHTHNVKSDYLPTYTRDHRAPG